MTSDVASQPDIRLFPVIASRKADDRSVLGRVKRDPEPEHVHVDVASTGQASPRNLALLNSLRCDACDVVHHWTNIGIYVQ